MPNYDESLKEPSVLPAKVPALLINGSAGIAVGMATNIPPHNLSEVVDGLIMLIDNSDIEIPELMTAIKGPDFPTGDYDPWYRRHPQRLYYRPWYSKNPRTGRNRTHAEGQAPHRCYGNSLSGQ